MYSTYYQIQKSWLRIIKILKMQFLNNDFFMLIDEESSSTKAYCQYYPTVQWTSPPLVLIKLFSLTNNS